MDFLILGPLEALADGRPLTLGGPKQRAVLALLLIHRGEVVERDRIVDALWGERPPASADKTIQIYVSNLRKVLGDGVLTTHGRAYAIDVAGGSVDLDDFERLIREGRAALAASDEERAVTVLSAALELWRGPPLADLAPERLLAVEAMRLTDLRLAALEERIEAQLRCGRHLEVAAEAGVLAGEDSLRERLQGQLMLALYRSGRQADALERYRATRRALVDDLGIEPSPPLRELQEQILRHDPVLDAPLKARGGKPEPHVSAVAEVPGGRSTGGGRVRLRRRVVLTAAVAGMAVVAVGWGMSWEAGDSPTVNVPPNSVAAIDPATDRVVGHTPVGDTPTAVAAGAGGVWVLNANEETVSRIDPRTREAGRRIATGGTPTDLAVGAGAVWVVNRPGTVTRIDPGSGILVRRLRIPLRQRPPGFSIPPGAWIAATEGGVWVSAFSTFARIDPDTTRLVGRWRASFGEGPLAVGAGSVWVGGLARVAPSTGRVAAKVTVPFEPADVAVGGGAVWLANLDSDTVWRIDPRSNATDRTIRVGDHPSSLAYGAGSLWVASQDGTVSRIDPRSNRVVRTIRVGGTPRGIAVGEGAVWVTVN